MANSKQAVQKAMIHIVEDVTLYFTEGNSDKQYRVWVEFNEAGKHGAAHTVQTAWGRRGGNQATATKTKRPVSLIVAKGLFMSIRKEKEAKGYRAGTDAAKIVTPQIVPTKTASSEFIPPMLLNQVGESEGAALIDDPQWIAQMKYDGIRAMLHKTRDGKVTACSRTGKPVAITTKLEADVLAFETKFQSFLIDGELVDGRFYAFDVLFANGDVRQLKLTDRLALLPQIVANGKLSIPRHIEIAPTATTTEQKRAMVKTLRSAGAEGIVFKKASAKYESGRPNSNGNARKLKFVATASVIVEKVNTQRSVEIMLDDFTKLGSVTIPPNKAIPEAGSIIEVRYLYAHRGGSLVQAVYLGIREDVELKACNAAQLQYKNEPRDSSPATASPAIPAPTPAPKAIAPIPPAPASKVTEITRPATDRSAAAKRAWVTIRANRAAAAAKLSKAS